MPYDMSTTIMGRGVLNAEQIDGVFQRRNGDAPPLGEAIIRQSAEMGLNSDFITAQIMDETGNWTSARATQANNPAGLGATDDGAWGHVFDTPEEGIRAECAHWRTLIDGPSNPFAAWDVRYKQAKDQPYAGHVRVVGDIGNGVWATAKDYASSVLTRMNAILRENGVDNGGTPPMAVPWDRIHLAADDGGSRDLSAVRWFVVHDTEGAFAGDESVLTSPALPVESVHFLVGRVRGQCVYSVPISNIAWTAGNDMLGAMAVQVELSKRSIDVGYTDYQYDKVIEIFNWCEANGMTSVPRIYLGVHPKDGDGGWLPDDAGLIGHEGVPDGNGGWGGFAHHTDPGPSFDWPRVMAGLQGGVPPVDDTLRFAETGQSITGNIKGYWEQFRNYDTSVTIFGFPVTPVVTTGRQWPTQYFERQVLEDHTAEGKGVLGRRLGAEQAKRDGFGGPGI